MFDGKLPESTQGSAEERGKNFLSRALAAYAVHKLGGASLDDAVNAIVDGGGDGGIDAVYFSSASQTLWVAQSKFRADGRGEPSLADVTKFKAGIENLLQGNFDAFRENPAWVAMIPKLESWFRNSALQVRPVLVYSGTNLVSDDRRHLFEDLKRRFSPDTVYLDFRICNLTTIHDWLTGSDQGPGAERVSLTLQKPGWVKAPYETIFGLVPLSELVRIYNETGKRIIAANIRAFKGRTNVNDQIVTTVDEEPENFFYLNNGVTAYCQRLEVNNLDRANAEKKRVTAHGISIVNGAQTLGSVLKVFERNPDSPPAGLVFFKIISLEKCEDDRAFAERITRSTNFQNVIGLREFVALHEQQDIIAKQLALTGVTYHYKVDVETPGADANNFTLNEATTACTCLSQGSDRDDLVARCLANRQSLWDLEEILPETELLRSRYSRVFRPDRSARTVWRAVQTQRIVIRAMQDNARSSSGVRKVFFENARWLVLAIVFLVIQPEQGEDLTLTADEESEVSTAAIEISEELFKSCEAKGFVTRRTDIGGGLEPYDTPRHFRSVFSALADCEILRNDVLAKLAQAKSAMASPEVPDAAITPPNETP